MLKMFRLDGRGICGKAALSWKESRNLLAGWKIKERHGKVQTTAAGLRDYSGNAGLRDYSGNAGRRDYICGKRIRDLAGSAKADKNKI